MGFTLYLWWKLVQATLEYHIGPAPVVIGFVAAEFVVDFVSGLLHWACDTWGEFTTPIVGPTLIRSFRMHHVDPQDITKHSFIETNASTTYPMPPFIAVALLLCSSNFFIQCYCWTIVFGVILGILTNEIHKWAHMVHRKPHAIIRFLQSTRLILSHEEHHRHHTG
jgi:ubiquitin-conjugating enzyme E2 variant